MPALRWDEDPLRSNILEALRQVNRGKCTTPRAMTIMVRLAAGFGMLIVQRAKRLMLSSGKCTLCSRCIQSAVRFVIDGELTNHAVSKGVRAVTNWSNAIWNAQNA